MSKRMFNNVLHYIIKRLAEVIGFGLDFLSCRFGFECRLNLIGCSGHLIYALSDCVGHSIEERYMTATLEALRCTAGTEGSEVTRSLLIFECEVIGYFVALHEAASERTCALGIEVGVMLGESIAH